MKRKIKIVIAVLVWISMLIAVGATAIQLKIKK